MKRKAAVENYVGVSIDLVGVDLAAGLQPVLAHDARKRVADFVDVLRLHQRRRVHAHGEVVECDILDAFCRRLQRDDSGKPLRCQRRSHAASRLTHGICVAHKAQVGFVQSCIPNVMMCATLSNCARPLLVASKPGTLAPPVPVG